MMASTEENEAGSVHPDALASARRQQAKVEEALDDLESVPAGGLTPAEAARAQGLRQAGRRLIEIAELIEREGLTVTGSMGQLRPHPLLSEERALRKEITDQLPKLDYQIRQRATCDRLNALTRRPELPRLKLSKEPRSSPRPGTGKPKSGRGEEIRQPERKRD
jgi:hypothetical protein